VAAQWLVVAVAVVGLLTLAVFSAGRTRDLACAALGTAAVIELAAMSLHSFPQRLVHDTPFTAYRQPTTEWLDGRDGFVIALTDDLREADYGVPGLRPNANVLNGIRSIDGYDGGVQVTERWAKALRRFTPEPATDLPLRNNLTVPLDTVQLARLGVRYVLIDNTRPASELVPGWLGPRVSDHLFTVWENPDWVGEAVAWSAAEPADPRVAADRLRGDIARLSATALVDGIDGFACEDTPAECAPVGLAVERLRPEHVDVTTDLERRGVVSVAQQFSPGWRAEVDGEPAELVQVDGLWLGVEVPAGHHDIDLLYRPRWLLPSLVVAALAVVATVCLAFYPASQRVRNGWNRVVTYARIGER
jgi:hypothetical protein